MEELDPSGKPSSLKVGMAFTDMRARVKRVTYGLLLVLLTLEFFLSASGLAGGGPLLYRTDIFDPENFSQQQTLIRGGLLFDNMHSVVYEVKYEPLGGDRCICKLATEYHPKEGVRVKEEDINSGKRTTIGFYQAIVDYLVANTDAYA